MQKTSKNILLSSLVLMVLLLSLSSVSAEDISDNDILSSSDVNGFILSEEGAFEDNCVLCLDSSSNDNLAAEKMESDENPLKEPKKGANSLKESSSLNDNVYSIDSDNFSSYFVDGVLKDGFNDSIFIFNGEFADKGIVNIKSPNVTVIGNNSLLRNTVFCLESRNIMLTGLNFALDQEFANNDYAGILVLGDNCTVYNCTMDYTVPEDTNGFCVYVEGSDDGRIQNFTLADNAFNFIGNNLHRGWDYGVFLDCVDDAIVYGNDINCSLPLRSVNWMAEIYGGVSMDAVASFVVQSSNNLTLSNNRISSYVNGGGNGYPTLDTIIIYGCNDATLENNSIYSEDFYCKDGKDNYLYGVDVYFANGVTILGNQIHIRTTGGREGMGTAYPIQINGPAYVKIAYNNISTVSFGPNIGIYSQNYYGTTKIDIISNFINVTGLASTHYWALVAGIEVQDSDDLIWNNTIIVNTVNEFEKGFNAYGISYSQSTNGDHNYNIQYNNVSTNGDYAVALKGGGGSTVSDSIVANNILNGRKYGGNRAVYISGGTGNIIINNTDGIFRNILNGDDLPDWLKSHKGVVPRIVIPKYYREGSNGSGLTDDEGNGAAPWNTGSNPNGDTVFGSNRDTAPGFGGDASPSFTAASPGESGSSAADPNVYEIDEHDNVVSKSSDYLQLCIICIVALLLLLVGYKRQKDKEEEE